MAGHKIEAHKITKPIQLMAVWFVALFLIDLAFLTAAAKITEPTWISPTLIISAIVFVPLFLAGVFLMQTVFRKELQEDPYYSDWLKNQTKAEIDAVKEKAPSIPTTNLPTNIQNILQSSPKEAINKSWQELENSATAAASISETTPTLKIAGELAEKNILTPREAEAFFKMHEIKEEITKPAGRFITDVSSATAFSSLAYGLSEKIQSVAKVKVDQSNVNGWSIVIPKNSKKEDD